MAERDERGRFLPKPSPSQNMSQFAKRMTIRGKFTPTGAGNLIRKLALAIDQQIVKRTPVNTGRARANWLVNIGSPASETIEPYMPGNPAGNTQGALNQARQAIGGSPDNVREIHITNNLDYIADLNNGTSAQAPKNFVRMAIADGTAVALGGDVKVTERG